jgi:serine protease Do
VPLNLGRPVKRSRRFASAVVGFCAVALSGCAGSSGLSGAQPTPSPTTITPIEPTTSLPPATTGSDTTTTATIASGTTAAETTTTATPVRSLEALYSDVENGVLRIVATTCDGSGVGTGFLVGPDLIVTAAHVVDGSVGIVVDDAGGSVTGTIVGLDTELDIALVRIAQPSVGHVFDLASDLPATGATVAAIGFPLDEPRTLTVGTISGSERDITTQGGQHIVHLLQTDVAINPGNSGGPLLDSDGAVVGIVSAYYENAQGIGYAAAAGFARPLVDTWRTSSQRTSTTECAGEATPEGPGVEWRVVPPPTTNDLTDSVVDTFQAYFDGINSGDYEQSRLRLAPARRPDPTVWEDALTSSFDINIAVLEVTETPTGALAWVTFTSVQDPDRGPRPEETCTIWTIDYQLIPADDGLLWIDHSTAHPGGPISHPCG